MPILCAIAGHRRGRILRNRGVEFSRCRRCGCDLVRRKGKRWKTPRGYRIHWPAESTEMAGGIGHGPVGELEPSRDQTQARPAAGRRDIAHISIYRPDPNAPDFMDDDGDDLFWDVPIAVRASFVRRAPKPPVAAPVRAKRWRRRV